MLFSGTAEKHKHAAEKHKPLSKFKGNIYTFGGENSVKIVVSSYKGSVLKVKKKKNASLGKIFLLRGLFLIEGDLCRQSIKRHKSCLPCKIWRKIDQVCQV